MASHRNGDDCGFCPSSVNLVESLKAKASKDLQAVTVAATAIAAAGAAAASAAELPPPPSPEEVGRSTWTFLHSMAAAYPDSPSEQVQHDARAVLRSLGTVYPCKWCRDDWALQVEQHPPELGSRAALEQWMCQRHNDVNAKLNKPLFDCSTTSRRWGRPNAHQ